MTDPGRHSSITRRLTFLPILWLVSCVAMPLPSPATEAPAWDLPVDPVAARDMVIAFVRTHHAGLPALTTTLDWQPVSGQASATTYQYASSSPWRVNLVYVAAESVTTSNPSLEEDMFVAELYYATPPPYVLWSGKWSPSGGISEDFYISWESAPQSITPEAARDVAVRAIGVRHPETAWPVESWGAPTISTRRMATTFMYNTGRWWVRVTWNPYTADYSVEGWQRATDTAGATLFWLVHMTADGEHVEELIFSP